MGSVFVAHRLSCSFACGIFPEKILNPCSLHCQADSYPLHHQGNPICWIIIDSLYSIVNVICISKPIVQVIHILKRGSAWHLDREIQACYMIYAWRWSRQEKENPLFFFRKDYTITPPHPLRRGWSSFPPPTTTPSIDLNLNLISSPERASRKSLIETGVFWPRRNLYLLSLVNQFSSVQSISGVQLFAIP